MVTTVIRKGTRLTWSCDTCGGPIAPGKGYMHISESDMHRHRKESREVTARVRAKSPEGLVLWSGSDLFALPNPVPWQVHHAACDPEPEANDYWFAIERVSSVDQVLSWSIHFMETKDFGKITNWTSLIYRIPGIAGAT